MEQICFWNGNKTKARQEYELGLLDACLRASEGDYGSYILELDNNDYPKPEDEGNVFDSDCDVLVTVAGNVKFENKQKIIINQPITKGLLGYRLLIIRNESVPVFNALRGIEDLQALSIGIPATWADAELFRQNHFNVLEQGTLDDIFARLKNKEFDFIALGANEIEEVFIKHVSIFDGMCIEASHMLYYPFPLIFYVHPEKPDLAKRIQSGLQAVMQNGRFEALFNQHHGDVVERLNLRNRHVFKLHNALLPQELKHFSATLLT